MKKPFRLGIIVPSNNPNAYFSQFSSSLSYLRHGLEDVHVGILLCDQGWSRDQLVRARHEASFQLFSFKNVSRSPSTPPYMCLNRQSAASLWPSADIYMLADDNMRFSYGDGQNELPHYRSSGQCYAEVLNYFHDFPRCGLVQCHTTGPDRIIRPTSNGLITTNKGLFLRNIRGGVLWPKETHGFRASLEETVAGYLLLEEGYFPARQHQNPTEHQIHKIGNDDALHSRELIMADAGHWVRDRYTEPEWEHEDGRFPQRLIARAISRGGLEVTFDSTKEAFWGMIL